MARQQRSGLHHLVPGRRAALGRPELVVQVLRAVEAQADVEALRLEEARPVLVEQHAVGLQVVLDALAGLAVAVLQRDHLLEERQPHDRGLAALPGEHHLVAGLRLDVLADVLLEQIGGDARVGLMAEQLGLVQIEAVRAVEVAQGPGRLDHRVEAVLPPGRQRRQTADRLGDNGAHRACRRTMLAPAAACIAARRRTREQVARRRRCIGFRRSEVGGQADAEGGPRLHTLRGVGLQTGAGHAA